jgi:hypothetical protein
MSGSNDRMVSYQFQVDLADAALDIDADGHGGFPVGIIHIGVAVFLESRLAHCSDPALPIRAYADPLRQLDRGLSQSTPDLDGQIALPDSRNVSICAGRLEHRWCPH